MLEHPVYVRLPTEDDKPYFENKSSAEAVISAIVNAQNQGWMRLHGFVVLPRALEMVLSPIRQGISGVVAYLQAEMTPILSVLLPEAFLVWSPLYTTQPLTTQKVLTARLEILRLLPIALNLSEEPEAYPYSSANVRYKQHVALYSGFARNLPPDNEALITGVNPVIALEDMLNTDPATNQDAPAGAKAPSS